MKKFMLTALTVVAVTFSALAARAQEPKPVVVVSWAGYDELIRDVDYLGKISDNPDLSKSIEGAIAFFTQFQGLAGLDKAKPVGIALNTDGASFTPLGFIPVTDLKKLLGVLAPHVGEAADAGDDVKRLMAGRAPLFIKEQKGWAFIGMSKEALQGTLPADPVTLLDGLNKEYDLGARIYVQNVPPAYRDWAMQLIQQSAEQNLRKAAGPQAEQLQKQLGQLKTVFNDLDRVSFGWAIDSVEKRFLADFSFTAVKGSKLAQQVVASQQVQTSLAGFMLDDAVFKALMTSVISPEDIETALFALADARKQLLASIDKGSFKDETERDLVRTWATQLVSVGEDTLKTGRYSAGAAVVGEGPFTFVVGGEIASGNQLEKLFLDVVSHLQKKPELKNQDIEITLNSDKESGITFHEIALPVPPIGKDAEKIEAIIGEEIVLTFGFSKDRFFVALGEDGVDTIVDIIESSAKGSLKTLPFQAALALSPILDVAAELDDDPKLKLFADFLEPPKDHIRLTTPLRNEGIQSRFEIEESILAAFGKLVHAEMTKPRR